MGKYVDDQGHVWLDGQDQIDAIRERMRREQAVEDFCEAHQITNPNLIDQEYVKAGLTPPQRKAYRPMVNGEMFSSADMS